MNTISEHFELIAEELINQVIEDNDIFDFERAYILKNLKSVVGRCTTRSVHHYGHGLNLRDALHNLDALCFGMCEMRLEANLDFAVYQVITAMKDSKEITL